MRAALSGYGVNCVTHQREAHLNCVVCYHADEEVPSQPESEEHHQPITS